MADHEHGENCECCKGDRQSFLRKIEQNIREHGCSIIGTEAEYGGRNLAMAYTIGLADKGLPELVVFSLPMPVSMVFLNQAAAMLREGTLPFDTPTTELSELPCVFKKVAPCAASDYIIQANNRAGHDLPAIQMFWPDPQGRFPWDAGFEKRFEGAQPLLYSQVH